MYDVDTLGRAIHAAKRVGGPWGPACSRMESTLKPQTFKCSDPQCGHFWEEHNSILVPWGCSVVDWSSIDCVNGYQGERPTQYFVEIEYNDNSSGEYDCECQSMAAHLIEIMNENRDS